MNTIKKIPAAVLLLVAGAPRLVEAFAQAGDHTQAAPAGLLFGFWHGMLAPWSLIARFFIENVVMYATPNTGLLYDLAYLIGVGISLPVGWLAAIFSLGDHFVF